MIANPEAITIARQRIHELLCSCRGRLEVCEAIEIHEQAVRIAAPLDMGATA